MNRDAKIGMITLLIALSALVLNNLRDAGLVNFGTNQLGLIFSQVHGLRAGDLVTIGGVPAGRVTAINFAPEDIQQRFLPLTGGVTLVRAEIELDKFRDIPKESTYTVTNDLNGRRWIEITVSPSKETVGPDDIFFAEQSARQDDQLQTTIHTFSLLSAQTEELRDVLANPAFRLRTKDTASNLRFYSRELRAASVQAPEQLRSLSSTLDTQETAMLGKLASFDSKTKEVRQRMMEMSPQLTENLRGWTERMNRQGDKLTATLKMAIERSDEYDAMLDKALEQVLDPKSVNALIAQTKKWARKLQEYRYLAEDLHALTSDPTVRADLKAAITKFQAKSVQMNERIEKLEKLIDNNPLTNMVGGGKREQPVPPESPKSTPEVAPTPTDAATSGPAQ